MVSPSTLLDTFFARQHELRGYFVARVGDAEADDLLQEAYIRIAALPGDIEVRNAGAYLYRLCGNIMLDRLRQQRARQSRDRHWLAASTTMADNGESLDETIPADRTLIARDRLIRLQAALCDVPDAAREAFRLHKFDGLSHSEVAERLGVSRSMVEKHIMRVLKHLLSVEE